MQNIRVMTSGFQILTEHCIKRLPTGAFVKSVKKCIEKLYPLEELVYEPNTAYEYSLFPLSSDKEIILT